jgi:chemotaxis family two-component system response regulator Rcp1
MLDKKIDIFLVEDSPSDVRLTEEALRDAGLRYSLTVASDGEEAMTMLRQKKATTSGNPPDVILLDLNMPKKNGHEVMTEIKAEPDLSSIPVVLLTVSQQEHDIMEALRMKMNYYLCKPIEASKLAILLKAIFELHSEEAALSQESDTDVVDLGVEDLKVRLVLAGNPHTTPVVLKKLANEKNERVRCRVAENPNTPPEVLVGLSLDKSAEVRLSVVENANTPKFILEVLSKDENQDVRLGMAENRHMPAEILQKLTEDENIFVASSAAKTLAS